MGRKSPASRDARAKFKPACPTRRGGTRVGGERWGPAGTPGVPPSARKAPTAREAPGPPRRGPSTCGRKSRSGADVPPTVPARCATSPPVSRMSDAGAREAAPASCLRASIARHLALGRHTSFWGAPGRGAKRHQDRSGRKLPTSSGPLEAVDGAPSESRAGLHGWVLVVTVVVGRIEPLGRVRDGARPEVVVELVPVPAE